MFIMLPIKYFLVNVLFSFAIVYYWKYVHTHLSKLVWYVDEQIRLGVNDKK